jgi:poly-beta-1,6-N-acetyl-D-glucosamine biosynthesis protein PgaD
MSEIKIIDKPNLKRFTKNISEWSFTTVMWAIYLYLILPVLNVILWLLGVQIIFMEVIEKSMYLHLLNLLENLGWCILIVFGILRIWGYYNYIRFGRKNRRKEASCVTIEQLAEFFELPPEQILRLQSQKEVFWPMGKTEKHAGEKSAF